MEDEGEDESHTASNRRVAREAQYDLEISYPIESFLE